MATHENGGAIITSASTVEKVATKLSPKQGKAWRLLEYDPTVTEILFGGAAGGGKSWFGCMWQCYRRCMYAGTRGLIGRARLSTLKITTLRTFFDFWEAAGQYNVLGVKMRFNASENIAYFSNGSEIIFKDLYRNPGDPDFKSLGSLELTDVFLDEVTEISEKAVEILSSRLRYRLDLLPIPEGKMLMACNPANNWVKWKYVLTKENKLVTLHEYQRFIRATLADNPNKFFVTQYGKNLRKMSTYEQRRLLLGDWTAIEKTGLEFYKEFEMSRHVKAAKYNPDLPVHLAFDQNVSPYITLTCWQVERTEDGFVEIRQIDEFCLGHPKNTTADLCDAFLAKYPDCPYVFIYGDASGHKGDTRSKDTDYSIILRKLSGKVHKGSDRTTRANPPVIPRRDFINDIFKGGVYNYRVFLAEHCHHTISDLVELKEDENGKKLKMLEVNNVTGRSYERLGHTSDSMDYIICKIAEKAFNHFKSRKR